MISKAVKLKRREVSTETGTLPNWTRTYYDFFLFELTTTKILRNIKIVVAHATWPAVGRIGCAGFPRPIWSKLDADVSVVLTPIIIYTGLGISLGKKEKRESSVCAKVHAGCLTNGFATTSPVLPMG